MKLTDSFCFDCTNLCLVLWLSPSRSSSSFSMLSMDSLQARLDFLHAVWLLESKENNTEINFENYT